jgi:hypothetical protein
MQFGTKDLPAGNRYLAPIHLLQIVNKKQKSNPIKLKKYSIHCMLFPPFLLIDHSYYPGLIIPLLRTVRESNLTNTSREME